RRRDRLGPVRHHDPVLHHQLAARAGRRHAEPAERSPRMNRVEVAKRLVAHALLLVGVGISIFPFYWMAVMATTSNEDIFSYPPRLWFGPHLWRNLSQVFDGIPFWDSLLNTVIVATATTVLVMFFSSLAAFAFAKFEFPGKKAL